MSQCACVLCESALFPRLVGQCHGYGRSAVACRNKALSGELLCKVHLAEQSPAIVALQREAARAAKKAGAS